MALEKLLLPPSLPGQLLQVYQLMHHENRHLDVLI